MDRETFPDGSLRLRAGDVWFTYERLRPGALLVRIRGYDRGELGTACFDPLNAELSIASPLDLFVDTTRAEGASTAVSDAWTSWFQNNRQRIHEVHILVASRFVSLTVQVAKHFSRTGELIQVHSDPSHFEAAAQRLVPGLQRLPAPRL
jgi:hypothetical protein